MCVCVCVCVRERKREREREREVEVEVTVCGIVVVGGVGVTVCGMYGWRCRGVYVMFCLRSVCRFTPAGSTLQWARREMLPTSTSLSFLPSSCTASCEVAPSHPMPPSTTGNSPPPHQIPPVLSLTPISSLSCLTPVSPLSSLIPVSPLSSHTNQSHVFSHQSVPCPL